MTDQVKQSKALKKGITRKYDDSANKSNYSSKSLPYDKRNVALNSQSQVTKFRKHYKEVSPDAQRIVDQIIDPEMCNDVSLIPSYGVGAVYTAHNIIDTKYDQNGEAILLVYPSLRDTIFYTSGASTVQTISGPSGTLNPYMSQNISVRQASVTIPFVNPFYFSSNHVLLSQPINNVGFLYAMRPPVAGVSNLEVHCTIADNHNQASMKFNVIAYDSSFSILSTATASFSNGIAASTLFANVLGIEWMAFTITTVAGSLVPFDSEMNLQILLGGGGLLPTINLTNMATHCLIQNVNESETLINSAESFFVSGQSCLLTYTGSEIASSGKMSIARVPSNTWIGQVGGQAAIPTVSSYYQYIASLSRNSYNSAAKHGGYCFYLGEDDRDYFYRPVEEAQEPNLPYIVAAYSTDATDPQSMRIMVTTIVQFTTNSNIYNQTPSPYLGEDWCKILHILSCINAAYDNSGHREKLKAALKKVGNKVLGLLKDPKTYATVGSIIAGLL